MDDALREKILASLDPGSDKKSDRALARALDRDPVAREYAASLRRVDRALRSWPVGARPESEWEASAARVLAAIEADAKDPGAARVLAGEIDPLAPPAFDDDASPMETRPAMSEPNEHDPDLENLAALTRTSLAPGAVPSVRPHAAPSISDAADDTSSGIVDIKQLSAMARDAAASAPPPAAAKAPAAEAKPAEVESTKPAKSEAKPASKKDDVMVTAKPAVPVVAAEPPRRAGGGPLWAIGGMAVMAGAFLLYNSSRDSAPTSPSAVESTSPSNTSPESVPQAVPSPAPVAPAEPAPAPAAEAAPVAAPAPPPPAVVAPAPEPAPEAQARRHARTEASEGAAATRAAAAPAPARTTAPTAPAAAPAPAARPAAPATTTAAAPAAPRGGAAAAAAPAPAPGRATSVDDLLNRAAPTATPAAAAAPAAPSADLPERLGRAQITGVLGPLNGAVRSCAQGQTGTAPVSIVIGNDGAVRTATVSGQFAGTPVGDCIAGVVRRAHFPAFRAPTQNLMFPYVITPPTGR